jgi:glycosyltransferase involved in cell wall biosynthesis
MDNSLRYSSPTFISFVLHLYGGKGHVLSYQTAVGEAVRLNGWDHLAAISPDPKILNFPSEWKISYVDSGVLDYEGVEIVKLLRSFRIWPFIKSIYKFSKDLQALLRRETKDKKNRKVIFMEAFNPLQLLSLVFALIFVNRSSFSLWLVYRGGPDWGGARHRLLARSFSMSFRTINPVLELFLGKKNLLLLTDSDKLKISLEKYYKRTVHVLPIPHTSALAIETPRSARQDSESIKCWWPGAPRTDKGLDIIKRLASIESEQAHKLKLFIAKSANVTPVQHGINVVALEDKLDREEYDRMFFQSDLVLLPYDQEIYSESTSGVFTEAIVAGVITLVTKDTWMAYELERHGLRELVIDWNCTAVIERLIRLSNDSEIREKILKMQTAYKKYHNIENFAVALKKLHQSQMKSSI